MAPHGSYTTFFASINVAQWRSALRLAIPSEHDGKKRGLFGIEQIYGDRETQRMGEIGNFSGFQEIPWFP